MTDKSNNQSCIICGSYDASFFCKKNGMEYLSCNRCFHIYVKNTLSANELEKYYKNRNTHHASKEKEKWDYSTIKYKYVYSPLLNKIERAGEKGKLLDIGCSNGSFVQAALDNGWDAHGVELGETSFKIAKSHGLNVYNKPLSELPFSDCSFSALTMWQVIEHLPNPSEVLNNIARILMPGGILAVSTPNIQSIGWWLLKEKWNAVEPEVHLNLFSKSGFERLINQSGFSTLQIDTLDIKPSTVKQYLQKWGGTGEVRTKNSVAGLSGQISEQKMKLLLATRLITNIPLKLTGKGEDLYGYFIKKY